MLKGYWVTYTRNSYITEVMSPSSNARIIIHHNLDVVLQSMEVGQLGRTGKIATLHAAMAGRFESVTATILHQHTTVKTVEKIIVNINHASSSVVVNKIHFVTQTTNVP